MKSRLFEIWLSLRVGPANGEFQTLLEQFGTPYDIFNAGEAEIEALPVSPRLKQALADKSLQESHRIMEYCSANGVGVLFWSDEAYPAALRPLRDPPALLYWRGRLPDLNKRLCISVVGTRSMSEYGKRMAYKIGYELAAAGAIVVSGMALGNDSVAAAAALCAGGTTVAVLGCGIDIAYPREHAHLEEEIVRSGVVMTEYPPGTPPVGHHFPVRNRIISGLSQGTLVVEGDLKSGSMITAKTAILQGRDIYALPGNVGETNSAGTNKLITEGAAVVLRARDVLENYSFLYRDSLNMNRLFAAERESDLDEAELLRLGVFTRTVKPAPTPAEPGSPAIGSVPGRPRPDPARPRAESRPKTAPRTPPVPARKPPQAASRGAVVGDASQRALASLTETQRGVFEAVPIDGTIALEGLSKSGFSMSDVMASVTILEIKGLIQTFPGGLIGRK